ncbi:hypothetical protein ATY27_04720 [Rheinheimera sp. F8]|nr:hypothetical protein ATY27_04720 [Rheinheimera sp. F8]
MSAVADLVGQNLKLPQPLTECKRQPGNLRLSGAAQRQTSVFCRFRYRLQRRQTDCPRQSDKFLAY